MSRGQERPGGNGRCPVPWRLERLHASKTADLKQLEIGRKVRIAGIVTHRQRPETASGVVFMSLEDETGISNLIVWPSIQATQRRVVFDAHFTIVQGRLQSESGVINVVAEKVRDYSHRLGKVQADSRDSR